MRTYSAEGYVIGHGDESTPTFYAVEEVDERIAELENALRGMLSNLEGHTTLAQCRCPWCEAAAKAIGINS